MDARPSTAGSILQNSVVLRSGSLEAVFVPDFGMLGVSLKVRGTELLRRIEDLESSARKGSTAGLPILYPWANRLAAFEFQTAGKQISLDRLSSLIHLDEQGLPNHGVPWAMLQWQIFHSSESELSSRLNWISQELLDVFPFAHLIEIKVQLKPDRIRIDTSIIANSNSNVPISFGFHPYFAIPNLNRNSWILKLPAMRRLTLNEWRIPTGRKEEYSGFQSTLDDSEFDDGFELLDQQCSFTIEGSGVKITLQLLEGYTHAQIFAPREKDFIALEPMTAPANALVSGNDLRIINAGQSFCGSFEIIVQPQ